MIENIIIMMIGFAFIMVGAIWLVINHFNKPLLEKEVELFEKSFEATGDEQEYMTLHRLDEARQSLARNIEWRPWAWKTLLVGVVIFGTIVLRLSL